MEISENKSTPSQIEVAQTVVAGLAQRPICRLDQMQTVVPLEPTERAAYLAALETLTHYLASPGTLYLTSREVPSALLSELRLSVRAMNVAEIYGVTTLKHFMALTPAEFADLCDSPKSSPSVAAEYRTLRNFMLRPVGVVDPVRTAETLSADLVAAGVS